MVPGRAMGERYSDYVSVAMVTMLPPGKRTHNSVLPEPLSRANSRAVSDGGLPGVPISWMSRYDMKVVVDVK